MADAKISALTSASTPLAGTEVLPIVQSGSTKKVTVANLTAGRSIATNDVVASGELVTTTNNARISMYRSTGTNYFDWASGQTLAFGTQTSQGGGGRANKVNFTDAGNVEIANGNLVISTAGKGIDFSANAHATGMTSELLNDYEEGTWTPAVEGSTSAGTGTYGSQLGYYTKIGNVVYFQLWLQVSTHTGTGDTRITGLPFTSRNVFGNGGATLNYAANLNFTANYVAQIQVAQNATYMNLSQYITGGGSGVTTIGIPVDANMQVQISGFYLV